MAAAQDLQTGKPWHACNAYLKWIPRLTRWLRRVPSIPISQVQSQESVDQEEPSKYSNTENDEACEKLWAIYTDEAERYDEALVQSWRGDMEGMLIFSGLFSASVTAFLIESYKSLTPDTGELAVQLLTRLSQQVAGEMTAGAPLTQAFRVPRWSIICNTLWFTSLTLSLTCALLATLVEQWAREFLHKTGMRPSPVRRARVVSFLYFGVERFGMPAIVEVLPMLLHLSLLLFFAGLVGFLFPVNEVVMALVAGLLGIFVLLYLILTILPIFAFDCPYRTPLSGFAWRLWTKLSSFRNISVISGRHVPVQTLTQAVIKHAFDAPKSRDERAIFWTVESLTDDNELLPFAEAIPDVVFGPKGFRQVNDHFFGSVLSAADPHTSLVHRLSNLLRDADNMVDRDPLKLRKQLSSLRAIWALCTAASRLPSSRKGYTFLTWLAETSVFLSRFHQLPPGLQISCSVVITDTLARTIHSAVGDIQRILEEVVAGSIPSSTPPDVPKLTMALASQADPLLISVSQLLLPLTNLRSLLQSNDRNRGVPKALTTATLVLNDPLWMIAKIRNTIRLLVDAFNSESTPYNLELTCRHIFAELHSAEWPAIRQKILSDPRVIARLQENEITLWVLPPRYQGERSLWRYQAADQSPTQLDYMMRTILRLLPFLHAESTLPLVYWYLANRAKIPSTSQNSLDAPGNFYSFLEHTDKALIETQFIQSMRSGYIVPGTLEAVASYYMQGVNSEENIGQIYQDAAEIVASQLPWTRSLESQRLNPLTPSSTYITVKAVLARSLWGHFRVRVHRISTDSSRVHMDEDTKQKLRKITQHPFLQEYELDLDQLEGIKPACSLIQHTLDKSYTSALDEIVASCYQNGDQAFRLLAALRTMCTFPITLGGDHQIGFVDKILTFLGYIKATHAQRGLYRTAVLTLVPPILDWFTNLAEWNDTSHEFHITALFVDALEIFCYENGAGQDGHANRALQLNHHFRHILHRYRAAPDPEPMRTRFARLPPGGVPQAPTENGPSNIDQTTSSELNTTAEIPQVTGNEQGTPSPLLVPGDGE
ncbi:hypothetical protein C8R43DRAFT_597924 [Mycena crocata]|nr:hypothetical protein C8R43DRAFT_597924 [Mycena crocata]